MFDRFTDKAKRSLGLARQAAQEFGHLYLGTEHLLHGLLSAGENGAVRILAANKVAAEDLLRDLSRRMPPRETSRSTFGQLPFTPQAKRTLELAMQAAEDVGHDRIGTEHLLVGLSDCGSILVADVLSEHGLTTERLRLALSAPDAAPEDVDSRKFMLEAAARIAKQLGDDETAQKITALIQRLPP
jgi:ATP-dependent Clp protease ATP-binding subunit ClpC